MIAQVKYMKFETLPAFTLRIKPVKGLAEEVVEVIRNKPLGSSAVTKEVRKIELVYKDCAYTVIFGRRPGSQKIGLISIFSTVDEASLISAEEKRLKNKYQ